MFIDDEKKCLRFDIPNSEADIKAQHNGIVDRTVGSYYMSDRFYDCKSFLSNFEGEYYIDISLCINNSKKVLSKLVEKQLQNAFKDKLEPQFKQIEVLKWLLETSDPLYKIAAPTVNDKKKYLRLDNEDNCLFAVKTLLLGDLMSLCFKKIGVNGFIIYIDKSPKFESLLSNGTILSWM